MDLSIISVNYNSLAYLRACVASIYQWTRDISFEIIVVDNASPKDDIDLLKQEFPLVKVVQSGKNLGFAGANNLGFKHAAADWILFLNPDTQVTSRALPELLEQARSLPNLGVAGCRLLNGDGSVQTSSIMRFPGIWNSIFGLEFFRVRWPKLWGIGPLFSKNQTTGEVEAVSGACMLVPRRIFEQIGMFSEDYFMYSEDIDLCYQAVCLGRKNYYIGQVSIIHFGGTSSTSERQTTMKTAAELRFCQRNYGRFYTLMFRNAWALNAIARLGLINLLRWAGKEVAANQNLDSASLRWNAVLKTLRDKRQHYPKPLTASAD